MTNEVKFEMDIDQPNDELLDYAKKHINENPDTRSKTLSEFRDLIFERGECSEYRLDDEFLLRFLRARKFDLKDAHKLIVKYYEFKEKNPEYFKDANLDRLIAIGDAKLLSTQPFFDPGGRRILFFRLGLWNPDEFTVLELFQAALLVVELGTLEPRLQILGGIVIFDMEGLNFQHFRHLSIKIVLKILKIILTIYPLRPHAFHVVNESPIFKAAYALLKPFLYKVKDKIFIHGSDLNSLYEYVSPDQLPKRLGGTHPDYGYKEWVAYVKATKFVQDELNHIGYKFTNEILALEPVL